MKETDALDKRLPKILVVLTFDVPEVIANADINNITNKILLSLGLNNPIDKIFYFIDKPGKIDREKQSSKLRIFHTSEAKALLKMYEDFIIACYYDSPAHQKILNEFSFKKISSMDSLADSIKNLSYDDVVELDKPKDNLLSLEDIERELQANFGIYSDNIEKWTGPSTPFYKIFDKDDVYFLKILYYLDPVKGETILRNVDLFKKELKDNGISVFFPVETLTGKPYLKIGDFLCELYNFHHDLGAVSEDLLRDLFIKLHTIVLKGDYANHPAQLSEMIESVLRQDISERVRTVIDELAIYSKDVEKGLFHGDVHSGNVVMVDGNPFLIDFELTYYGSRVYDLAKMFTNKFFSKYKLFNFKEMKYLLTRYLKKCPLTAQDKIHIFHHMVLCTIWKLFAIMEGNNLKLKKWFDEETNKLIYLLDQQEDFISFFKNIQ